MCQGDGFQLRQGSSGGDPGSLGSLERAHGVLATPGEPRDGKVLGRQGLQSPHLQTRRESRKASQRAEVVGGIYAGKSGGLSGETQDFTDSLFIVLRGARRDALNDPSGVNRHHRADEGLWWTQFVLHKLARCTRDHGTNFGCLRTTSTLPTIQRLTYYLWLSLDDHGNEIAMATSLLKSSFFRGPVVCLHNSLMEECQGKTS